MSQYIAGSDKIAKKQNVRKMTKDEAEYEDRTNVRLMRARVAHIARCRR